MSPGWKKEWHVGVRATKSKKLVASICGVPTELRVRGQKIKVTEINFLCIHKKLRSKRLTPVLIKEITRRCYLNGIYQAIYTAGVVLPTPVSSCRYYHRPLDWLKLYEVGFSPLPHGSTKARQITKNHLPSNTSTPGLRPMELKDVDAVQDLLERYLRRFDMNQAFTKDEVKHWLVHRDNDEQEQVVWSYVVEDPKTHKITDFFSFYSLASTVIQHPKHKDVCAAYLYYYATETAFQDDMKILKDRLQMLMNDALILAKKVSLSPAWIPLVAPHMTNLATRHVGPLRRVQRPHSPRQPPVPGSAQVRRRRRPAALLPVQLPDGPYPRRREREEPPRRQADGWCWCCDAVERKKGHGTRYEGRSSSRILLVLVT